MVPGPRAALTALPKSDLLSVWSSRNLGLWTMPAYHISSLEIACEAPLPQPGKSDKCEPCIPAVFLSHHTSLAAQIKEKGNSVPLTLHNLTLNLLLQPIPLKPCPDTLTLLLRFCLFYQCLTHLTDGPGVPWARLPLVKTPAGSPLPRGHISSSIATLVNLKATGLKKQTKIIPTDRAGSILTFCKWFPFIKAAHEWLVVVGCTLYLPNTPTAFWTHLIKQIVNKQLVSTFL